MRFVIAKRSTHHRLSTRFFRVLKDVVGWIKNKKEKLHN